MDIKNLIYQKKSIWQMVAIYLAVGFLAYGLVYYFYYLSKKGNYAQSTTATVAKDITGTQPKTEHDDTYTIRVDQNKGKHMTDSEGMSLYVFDQDVPGVSNCEGSCSKTWPPYFANIQQAELPPDFKVMTRNDGKKQFLWMNRPLYYYLGDKKPGDISGDGVDGTWHLISL